MPTARSYSAAAADASGRIYVIGGEVFNDCTPISTVERYNPDSWIPVSAILPPVGWRAAAGTLNNLTYVVGGQTGCPGVVLDNMASYDPATNTWSTEPHMLTARFELGVAVDTASNNIYAIGGTAFSAPNTYTPLNTVEVYNTTTHMWTTRSPMPTARSSPNVAVVAGKTYAIGGSNNSGNLNSVEEYNPATNTWTQKLSMPTARQASAAGVLNGKIYVVGGRNASGPISTVEAYDPSNNTWATMPSMPTARNGLVVAVANNILYAVGGESGGAATVGQPFIYQITATNNPTSYDAFPLPSGLSVNHTLGIISGVPTTSVDTSVTFTATNGGGTGSKVARFHVQSAPPAGPKFVNNTSATGRTGQAFGPNGSGFKVLAQNASSSARFAAGGLPPGLSSIDPITGLISGTPTSGGNFIVHLGITDGSATTNAALQLTVISDPDFTVPIISSPDNAIVTPGQFFSPYRMTADAAGNFSYIGN